ncbi:Pregnancy-associated plasma protein-A [Cnuella takakiae]|uniref:Pregnancy-associated plasma protein-A n=1 Tax=Cnuella takakiae TaxID=1302690 RepID=A0A1M4UT76_9BACT|nr:zinc metalloprotease [Cnuella takakiae]OLY92782.1 hypothetical protein BUE76_13455 [Cnuella takakiae]SHE59936.1 Pregnancy-associated plasma protein-A [Cnuella takakiae]
MKKRLYTFAACLLLLASCVKKEVIQPEQSIQPGDAASTGITSAAPRVRCVADELLQKQIAANPERGRNLEILEATIQGLQKGGRKSSNRTARQIQVIIHIVLPDPAIVTDAQVRSQIDVLNEDFNKANKELAKPGVYLAGYDYNTLPVANIQFVLDGVIRKATKVSTFSTDDDIKFSSEGGSDAVSPATKLNIWVGDIAGGILGYAQFPGGDPLTDGLVLNYLGFGRTARYPLAPAYALGRTATHEMGHWLNLRHIWGDRRCGDDRVEDTPQHDGPNFSCGTIGSRSLCSSRPLEQWMNYMDYSYDRCLYMFTRLQQERMNLTIEQARNAYFTAVN